MTHAIRCLIAVAALSIVTPSASAEDPERLIDLLDAFDATTLSVDYHMKPLEEVLEDLDDRTEVPLRADWELLRSIGVQPRQPISLRMQHAPVSTVLAALLLQLGDRFEHPVVEAWAGHVMLTTYRGTERMRVTSIYDVRDLITTGDAVHRLRAATTEGGEERAEENRKRPETPPSRERLHRNNEGAEDQPHANNAGADEADGNVANAPPMNLPPDDLHVDLILPAAPQTPAGELMMLIVDHVDPEAWMSYGGTRAAISERDGVLLVSAPASIHRKCRDVLRMLRRADPSTLLLEFSIVDIPRSTLEHLSRRFDFAETPAAQAVLGSPEATLQWSGRVIGALDEEMSLSSEEEGRRFLVQVTPSFDRSTGRVTIVLAAHTVEGADRRDLQTSLTVPLRGGAAVLEMPSAAADGTARLLVVVPRRQ